MHDPVQRIQLALICEHDLPERPAIETAIALEDILPPTPDDVSERLRIRLDRFSREHIGIDHGRAAIGEHFCDL
jgi:hypothetical protein